MKITTKVLDILDLFLTLEKEELSFSEIVNASGLKTSTAQRILRDMINRNYLIKKRKIGHYALGMRFFELTNKFKKDDHSAVPNAISYLLELSRIINASLFIQIWYGSEVLFSKALDPSQTIPVDWVRMPLHNTSVGKIALANLSEEDYKKYFKRKGIYKSTSRTITDVEEMKKELAKIKLEGIAFEEGEIDSNMASMATGIKNSYGETIGAVFLIGDCRRFTHEIMLNLSHSLKIGAEKLSQELGYKF